MTSTGASTIAAPRGPLLFMGALVAMLELRTESAARRFVDREGIPTVRVGRRLAVRASTFERWLAERETAPAPRRAALPPAPAPRLDLLRGPVNQGAGRGGRRRRGRCS